jgi:putative transposase
MKNKRVHFNIPGHAHELTFSCYRRQQLLLNHTWCDFLAESIEKARSTFGLHVYTYVFMPEHVHLLFLPFYEAYSIARILQYIKQASSRRVMIQCRKVNLAGLERLRTGSKSRPYRFWQAGGGYDRNIINGQTLRKAIDYIHANPVRRNLVSSPEEWRWSSYSDWAGLGIGPIAIEKDIAL